MKIQAADLAAHVQGGIPDDEFGDAAGKITPKGLAQLKKVMPQIDADELAGKLEAEKVMSLFTVENLTDMVAGGPRRRAPDQGGLRGRGSTGQVSTMRRRPDADEPGPSRGLDCRRWRCSTRCSANPGIQETIFTALELRYCRASGAPPSTWPRASPPRRPC